MPWTVLPAELIVRILDALDPQALVNCRRLCRLFKLLIDETISLRYRIELYTSGMVDGPPGRLSTSDRLGLLRSYNASWKILDWNAHTCLPVPEGRLWELYGNVWAHSRGSQTIELVQLPSRLRGIPLRQWTLKLAFAPRDFGMDPAQDLLVTVERVTNAHLLCRVRLLTLSSGETHPLAKDRPTLEYTRTVPDNPHIHWTYSIRVCGDYLGILFINDDIDDDEDGNELVVWNWKTGANHLKLTLVEILSFTFLGEEFVLVAASAFDTLDDMRPALLLYNFKQAPGSVEPPDAYLLRFLFQPPLLARVPSAIYLTSDPSPDWSSSSGLQVPFQVPCDERLIAFNLHRFHRGDSGNETFLIPARTLLEHVGDITTWGEKRDIEWEEWGSSYAEYVCRHGQWPTFSCFVFGMRHVLPMAEFRDDRWVMIVRDLCPRRCMSAREEERNESNALHQALGWEGQYPRSIVKRVPLPTSIRKSSKVNLMISEDGIIVLEADETKKLIHLLTF